MAIIQSKITRCSWCGTDELYTKYHDEEWGKPTTNEQVLFEFLILEAAQAGLSWITILRRRANYREAFANFDPVKVVTFTPEDVARLMQDAGIIRNWLKITSAISTARIFLETQKEFGSFHKYLAGFFPEGKPLINEIKSIEMLPSTSEISDKISKDLKKRGVKFMGSTICYAYLQAVGFVNDHIVDCSFR